MIPIKTPVVIVNFKAYEQAIGRYAVKLAKRLEKSALDFNGTVLFAVDAADIYRVSSAVKVPVIAQHVDAVGFGGHTGSVNVRSAKEAGAVGSLLSHSEKILSVSETGAAISRLKEEGMLSFCCVPNANKAATLIKYRPDFVAVEPPELIGGNVSISTAQPEVISDAVNKLQRSTRIPLLAGAGIKNSEDVSKAKKLGAKGILVASGVVLARSPSIALKQLMKGFDK